MTMWLYQMDQRRWSPNSYRMDIWENERWSWPIGRKATTDNPVPGDRIVFFYAPSGGDEPGFYGWAIVLDTYEDERGIYFRPVVPSDHLKMDPWWDDKAKAAADEIRGKVKQGTLWQVPDDLAVAISSGITSWLSRPADESRLNAMIAQHQKLRLRFREEDRHELDRLTVLMRKQLFAALPRVNLLASATQMVRKIIPGVTAAEARSLSEYVLGGIASGDAIGGAAAAGSSQTEVLNATKEMQETQMSFNLQYLQLQSQMQHENRSYTAISNIMKTKHDTVKNSINNVQ